MKVTKREDIPCWPGQTMYTNIEPHSAYKQEDRPHKVRVYHVGISEYGRGSAGVSYDEKGDLFCFLFDDIGTYLFFTREEALAALEKEGGTDGCTPCEP